MCPGLWLTISSGIVMVAVEIKDGTVFVASTRGRCWSWESYDYVMDHMFFSNLALSPSVPLGPFVALTPPSDSIGFSSTDPEVGAAAPLC